MYVTANGRAPLCCLAPFSQRGYENYTLGDATQRRLRESGAGEAYRDFRRGLLRRPPAPVAGCAGASSHAAIVPYYGWATFDLVCCIARGGTLENNELSPSAIVGCAKSPSARRE
jgi:hypothetical protein